MRSELRRVAPIYLDYQATTPCDEAVVEAMLPHFREQFANPASKTHGLGRDAYEVVESARRQVAGLLGADAREIVFTSGATEANNLAVLGTARALGKAGDHIVTCQTEHKAVLDPVSQLEREGFRVTRLPVGADGLLDLDRVSDALAQRTLLISVMHANNEIGVIQDLGGVAAIARERGVLFHTDAAQSAGKIPLDVREIGVDLVSLSAHKLYGPKGIGALYVRRRQPALRLEPLVWGGGHERGLRSGTLPVPLCVGFGVACDIAEKARDAEASRQRSLARHFWQRLEQGVEGVWLNGEPERRLPGNLNVGFDGVEVEVLLLAVPELALSWGSACTSATREPSHVLKALGLSAERALSSLRISLGRPTSETDVDLAADLLIEHAGRLRRPGSAPGAKRRGRSRGASRPTP